MHDTHMAQEVSYPSKLVKIQAEESNLYALLHDGRADGQHLRDLGFGAGNPHVRVPT